MPGARTRCSIRTIPRYGELATLTVQIGSGLHYNPLTNHDAAVWWVREAADVGERNTRRSRRMIVQTQSDSSNG